MINQYYETIETEDVKPLCVTLLHGESVLLNFSLTRKGVPISLNKFSCKFYYNTKQEQDNEWYEANATIDTEKNIVSVNWLPTMDDGSPLFNWFVRLQGTTSTDISYRICGKFVMLKSPNFTPNKISLPKQVLNFDELEVKNEPYYSKAKIDSELKSIDVRLEGHDKEIDDLREAITGGADESLKKHEENYNNPHKVNVGQLTDKSAGTLVIVFDDESQNLSGEFRFEFDPYMFNRGNLNFTLNVGEYAPLPIANRTITYNGKVHFVENWMGNEQWPMFVTEGRVGDNVYFYVQVIDLKETSTSSARLFFLISGDSDATNISQTSPFGDCVPSSISEFVYQQGGIYQVLTEKILRDKETNKAYTMVVENGGLKLQEYRISEYEA